MTTFYASPALADFTVTSDGSGITANPMPDTPIATVEHIHLNQVLPLALSRSGKLVLHGSAVEACDGAIAFLAETGRGKSTLAAGFAVSGRRFLTDDGIVLERSADTFLAIPNHPSIRLWQDSHKHLLDVGAETAPPVAYTSKARFLAGSTLTHCNEAKPLRAAYFLGPGDVSKPVFQRLGETDALISWTKHSFMLDIEARPLLADHFDKLAALTALVPCFHLDYPRNFGDLPKVLEAIISHVTRQETS